MTSKMNRPKDRIKTAGRKIHSYLKWTLSAASATLTASFVVILETEL